MRRLLLPILCLALTACMHADGPARTRVTERQTAEGRAFVLKNRDLVMTMQFPESWRAQPVDVGDDLIARNNPQAAFGIAVYVPTIPNGDTPKDDPWRRGALEAIETSLQSKAPAEYAWVSSEPMEMMDAPSLRTTVRQPDGTIIRDTYFFRGRYLFTASLVVGADALDAVWPDVETALQGLAFEEDASDMAL